jgi:hypothetical protein
LPIMCVSPRRTLIDASVKLVNAFLSIIVDSFYIVCIKKPPPKRGLFKSGHS